MTDTTKVKLEGNRLFNAQDFSIVEKILRNRHAFFEEVREGVDLQAKMRAMLISSICFFALYGAVMGSTHSLWQTLSSAAKLPILFLATLFVCVPSLYFFSLLFGSNQSLSQNITIILTAITVTAVLLLSCAPITLFFLLTTTQYQFFKLLNVAIFAVSGLMGVVFLYQGMKIVSNPELEGANTRRWVLIFWMFVYAFVGSQMAWTIRPFIGAPGTKFELFRQLGGNFYSNVIYSIGEILGFFIVR
ncbi:MAG: actin-binding WH2 domain-containing protein [Anaerolinea sp.]|nr:actin-binding WH2 domain-containing protein [Anaerolinea sp.]